MAARRLTTNQIMVLIEGAEMVGNATGLSVAEVVHLVLSEPVEHDQQFEEVDEARTRQAAG